MSFSLFSLQIKMILDAKVVVPPTRSAVAGENLEGTWVYFNAPASVPPPNPGGGGGGDTGGDPTMPLPQTVTDLLEMASDFETDLSLDQDGSYNDSILVSDDEARMALASLVDASRSYFVSNGLTQIEITEAINESGEDETMIVPLATYMAAHEASSPTMPDVTAFFPNPFVTFVHAESKWSKALTCAIEVMGLDVIQDAVSIQAWKHLTKKMLVVLIKKVAIRFVGPVGALIIMAQYAHCTLYG